jgi:hypothetical protein
MKCSESLLAKFIGVEKSIVSQARGPSDLLPR